MENKHKYNASALWDVLYSTNTFNEEKNNTLAMSIVLLIKTAGEVAGGFGRK